MRLPLASLVAILLLPVFLHAGEKKPPPVGIRLHGEGNEREGVSFVKPVDLVTPAQKIFIRIVPVITEKDIKAFAPFPGRDGTIGAYFRLDAHGSDKLQQFSVEDRGKLAVVLINGRVSSAMRVESPVNDGILYIPGGLLPNEVSQLQATYPIIGQEAEFRKKPKKAQAP